MQFLGVGWQEVLVVGILAFFVIGPERMPVVAYQIGKAVRTLQTYARAVRDEFGEEIGYVEEQYKTVRGDFDAARQEVRQQQRAIESEWRKDQQELEAGVKDVQGAVEGAAKVVNISDRTPAAVPAAAVAGASAVAQLPEPVTETTQVAAEPAAGPPLVF